jgi:hypothetical protein
MVAAITLPGEDATMPTQIVHEQIQAELERHVDARVDRASRARLALLVSGMIEAGSACPARIAAAVRKLGLSEAKTASLERQIRRIENDPELTASLCVHPFARAHLRWGCPKRLLLILDPTSQDERVVMLSAAVWYRGRALPLAWAVWPANTPLAGPRFWARVEALLKEVAGLLPAGVPVTWLADRAFGTPAFTDQVAAYGWHWVVRVQGQTRFVDQAEREACVRALVAGPGCRAKRRGWVFKKAGWREASVVAFWGRRHTTPLLLVSDLPAGWELIAFYRQRYPIEACFRDYKSSGWQWEKGQVVDLAHVERLLVGMALASWLVICAGAQEAAQALGATPTGQRRTLPYEGKRSLFTLGLQNFARWVEKLGESCWQLTDWDAPNWSHQLYFHHARAFVLPQLPSPVRP